MRLFAGLVVACALAAAANPDVKEVKKTIPLKPDALVSVQADQGSVEITGWDRPELEVNARIELAPEAFQSKTAVQDTEIKIETGDGGAVQIRADYSKVQQSSWSIFAGGPVRPPVHYKINMPRGARLRVRTETGPATIQNVRGEVDFETIRGAGRFSGLEGPVRFKTMHSDIEAKLAKAAGPSRIETFRGKVTIYLPPKSKFDIDPELGRAGSLTSDFGKGPGEAVKQLTKVNGGGASYRSITHRGVISFKKL